MLQISIDQIKVLCENMDAEYRYRLQNYFRAKEPNLFNRFDDRELDRRIGLAIESIRKYGHISDEGFM